LGQKGFVVVVVVEITTNKHRYKVKMMFLARSPEMKSSKRKALPKIN
jgi:hypothetical protein